MITEDAIEKLGDVLMAMRADATKSGTVTYGQYLNGMSKEDLIILTASLIIAANDVVQSRL